MEYDFVYTTDEVAKLLKCSQNAVRSMEDDGKLHRLPNVPGVKFSGLEVARLRGDDPKYEELLFRCKQQEKQIEDYQTRMARIGILTNMGARIQ